MNGSMQRVAQHMSLNLHQAKVRFHGVLQSPESSPISAIEGTPSDVSRSCDPMDDRAQLRAAGSCGRVEIWNIQGWVLVLNSRCSVISTRVLNAKHLCLHVIASHSVL